MSSHASLRVGDETLRASKRSVWSILRRIAKYLKPYRGLALATIGCAILSLAFQFVFPNLTGYVIDEVIANDRGGQLPWVCLGLLGAFLFSAVFNSLRIRVNNHFEQNVVFDMRREVYGKLQRLPANYFDQRASGDLMTRVIEDVNNVERVLIDGTEQGTVAILSIVGAFAFMFTIHPVLAGVALIPIPFLVTGAIWYTTTAKGRYRRQREASSAMNALLMDNLQGNRQIKAFAREPHEDARFQTRAEDLRQSTLGIMRAWANYSPSMDFFGFLGTGAVLWVGGALALNGQLEVGEIVKFLLFLSFTYEPIRRLHGLNQLMQGARAAGERIFDILDAEPERAQQASATQFEKRVEGRVVYKDVAFAYDEDKTVLSDIELTAEPGQMIALVGPTGAGKSTLVHLLPAFYERTAGTITIDGIDTSTVTLASLRDQIAIVSQEPFLFNGTVRENILYGRLDATEEEMIEAARIANCHDFIAKLQEGYDTRVGERGLKLSVGEKQRVSIARALLKDAPILILDEATASVDTATERSIQEALERLMKGRTSFVIAHRLSTVRNADQILVIQGGRIIEQGDHNSLLETDGVYAKLARIQNTTFIEERFDQLETA